MKKTKEEHIQLLLQFLNEKKLEDALNYLESLSIEERSCWEIENITGMLCSYCGQYEEAISFFRRALQENSDIPDIYYNLADVYFMKKDYAQAELMLKTCEFLTEDAQLLDGIEQIRKQMAAVENQEKEEEKKVLMIAYYFPPLSGSGVFRSLKFANYLPDFDWKPTVISAEEPPRGWNFRDNTMVKEIRNEVEVIRIADDVCTDEQAALNRDRVSSVLGFLRDVLKYDSEALNIFGRFLADGHILQMVTFPCPSLCWAWDVVNYIENNLDISKFNVIFTTSGPSSAHLIGFYLNKKYGIPWVTDFRDPWTYNAYGRFNVNDPLHQLLYRLERLIIRNAGTNIILGEGGTKQYVERFGARAEQMSCITNGYDEADFVDLEYPVKQNDKFTIGYSGLIYTQQQSVLPIFQALKELGEEQKIDTKEITFRIVGQGKETQNREIAAAYGMSDILEQTGYVSHKEALQNNVNSDLLLLLVGDEDRCKEVYTGKVFEYLRSGRYILAIVPKGGYVDALLSATGHGETFLSTQVEAIKEAILKQYQSWKINQERSYLCSPVMRLRDRKYLTMKLADVLNVTMKKMGNSNT